MLTLLCTRGGAAICTHRRIAIGIASARRLDDGLRWRPKHIERRHFYIRDMVEAQEIVVPLVGTQENDADFFTKPLPPKRFKFLRRRVMNLRSDASDEP